MSQTINDSDTFFSPYKGYEPWLKCKKCKCHRPPNLMEAMGELEGMTIYRCRDKSICVQLRKGLKNGR